MDAIPQPVDHWSFMAALADVLRLPDESLAMAYAYLNRFERFSRHSESIPLLDSHTLALSSLSLASKATEAPRRVREFIVSSWHMLHPENSQSTQKLVVPSRLYETLRSTLIYGQLILLRVLKFELRIPLPFEYLPRYLDRAISGLESPSASLDAGIEHYDDRSRERRDEDRVIDLMETRIAKASRLRITEAYKDYQLANFFPARAVAAACLHLTLRDRGLAIKRDDAWLSNLTGGRVDYEDFEEAIAILESVQGAPR